MDELVLKAMAKWPHVPACTDWLGLDDRGEWWMRDNAAQSAGPFQRPVSHPAERGSRVDHGALKAFIGRNYTIDATGCAYFQNGPQKVYVELLQAPWVARLQPDEPTMAMLHTGQDVPIQALCVSDAGRVYVKTPVGLAVIHPQDVLHAAEWVETKFWVPEEHPESELETRYGFVRSPAGRTATTR